MGFTLGVHGVDRGLIGGLVWGRPVDERSKGFPPCKVTLEGVVFA